jgi:hypothetical protein
LRSIKQEELGFIVRGSIQHFYYQ